MSVTLYKYEQSVLLKYLEKDAVAHLCFVFPVLVMDFFFFLNTELYFLSGLIGTISAASQHLLFVFLMTSFCCKSSVPEMQRTSLLEFPILFSILD